MKKRFIFLLLLTLNMLLSFAQRPKESYNFPSTKGDSFYVNKVLFRIKDKVGNAVIEKYINHQWNAIDTFDIQDYDRSVDVDKNGYSDIALWGKLDYDVYLFNPEKNTFVHSGIYSIRELNDSSYKYPYPDEPFDKQKMKLINKKLQLYYDYQPQKRGQTLSYLFQLKDYKRIDLAVVFQFGEYSQTDKIYTPTSAVIYKINDNFLTSLKEDEVERIDKTDVNGFDYATYWKNNWQKFLPREN